MYNKINFDQIITDGKISKAEYDEYFELVREGRNIELEEIEQINKLFFMVDYGKIQVE